MTSYIEKFQLKTEGLNLEKENPEKAIEFYKKLLNNKYFINDYYVYRRLVLMYKKTKEYDKKVNVIRCFFKSDIYCNKRNYLWFRNKLRLYSKKGYISEREIIELTDYFKAHGLKNKDKSNTPAPIAERLKNDRGRISVISEDQYDKRQKTYELEEIGGELKRQGKYNEFIELYNKMIDEFGYRSYRYYKSLCIAYRKTNDLDNELRIINKYYDENATKTEASDKWFEKRLNEVKSLSNKEINVSQNYNDESDLLSENKRLKEEIELLKKQLNEYQTKGEDYNIFNHFTGEFQENLPEKEISKALGTEDEYIYSIAINPNFEFDLTREPSFEYDEKLDAFEKIIRKILLKEYGRQLVYDKQFDNGIKFYNELKDNDYFKDDWYPYRQLTIIYDRTKNYHANLENIKNILLSGIYLNDYQYIWFTNKIKNIQKEILVDDEKIESWLEFYDSNGARNKSKLNWMLADRITKKDNEYKILSQDSFNIRQTIYEIDEIGRIYEREGDYELAIYHYESVISDPPREFNDFTIEKYKKQVEKIRKKL